MKNVVAQKEGIFEMCYDNILQPSDQGGGDGVTITRIITIDLHVVSLQRRDVSANSSL